MKKIIFLLCFACLVAPQVFGGEIKDARISINNSEKTFDLNNYEKKDPKLIKISNLNSIDENKYAKKLQSDNLEYAKLKKSMNETYYELYKILDKLLRANNLYYQNWRVGVHDDVAEINAMTTTANLIVVNTSLYDSFYNDEDALAFVLAHELSHQIYGHGQKSAENKYKIKQMEDDIFVMREEAKRQRSLANLNNIMGNPYSATGSNLSSATYNMGVVAIKSSIKKLYEEERKFEIEADSEGIVLMARAGYDVNSAQNALKLFSKIPKVITSLDDHPSDAERMSNASKVINSIDIEELQTEGKNNIYGSHVLEVKKSSDNKSIIISKADGAKYDSYVVENKENSLMKKAYKCYLNDDFRDSKIYFEESFKENPKNYIPALYLSYINELEYNKSKNNESLKQAMFWAKKANKLNSDINTIKQKEDVENIIKNNKKNK